MHKSRMIRLLLVCPKYAGEFALSKSRNHFFGLTDLQLGARGSIWSPGSALCIAQTDRSSFSSGRNLHGTVGIP